MTTTSSSGHRTGYGSPGPLLSAMAFFVLLSAHLVPGASGNVSQSKPEEPLEDILQRMYLDVPDCWTNAYWISTFDLKSEDVASFIAAKINRLEWGKRGKWGFYGFTSLEYICREMMRMNGKEGVRWALERYPECTVWGRERVLYGLKEFPSAEVAILLSEILDDKTLIPGKCGEDTNWRNPFGKRICDNAYDYLVPMVGFQQPPPPRYEGTGDFVADRFKRKRFERDHAIAAYQAWWATNSAALLERMPKLAEPGSDLEKAFQDFNARKPWLQPPAPELVEAPNTPPREHDVSKSRSKPTSQKHSVTEVHKKPPHRVIWVVVAVSVVSAATLIGFLIPRRNRRKRSA